jgi:hypothetical protein
MKRLAAMLAVAVAVILGAAPSAGAAPTETVIQDDAELLHRPDDQVRASMDRIRALGIDRVRLTAGWSVLAPDPDAPSKPSFDASDPAAYPQAAWRSLDRAVALARAAGLDVMIDIAFWAPRWATRDEPSTTGRLRTEIDPVEYARFAQAVVRRYSGLFRPPADSRPAPPSPDGNMLDSLLGRPKSPPSNAPAQPLRELLPAVRTFTLWNEPNHPGFLMPQWTVRDGIPVPRSPEIYRAMIMAAYPAIKLVAPDTTVLIGGTSSGGSAVAGRGGVLPLRFLRELACVDEQLNPVTTGSCAGFVTLPGDGWAHHPYSLRTTPDKDSRYSDALPVAATPRLAATLQALVERGRLAPRVADLYLTEYGYETSPPDPRAFFTPREQARLLAQAEYIASRTQSVKTWPQFLLRDLPGDPAGPQGRAFGDWQSGLFFADGSPKPSAASFRAPLFAACQTNGRRTWTVLWGRVRRLDPAGTVGIESRTTAGAAWVVESTWRSARRAVALSAGAAAVAATGGGGFTRYVPYTRGDVYRLRWTDPTTGQQSGIAVRPAPCAKPARR